MSGGLFRITKHARAKRLFADASLCLPFACALRGDPAAPVLDVIYRRVGNAKICRKLHLRYFLLFAVFAQRVVFHSATHGSTYAKEIQRVAHELSKLRRVALWER